MSTTHIVPAMTPAEKQAARQARQAARVASRAKAPASKAMADALARAALKGAVSGILLPNPSFAQPWEHQAVERKLGEKSAKVYDCYDLLPEAEALERLHAANGATKSLSQAALSYMQHILASGKDIAGRPFDFAGHAATTGKGNLFDAVLWHFEAKIAGTTEAKNGNLRFATPLPQVWHDVKSAVRKGLGLGTITAPDYLARPDGGLFGVAALRARNAAAKPVESATLAEKRGNSLNEAVVAWNGGESGRGTITLPEEVAQTVESATAKALLDVAVAVLGRGAVADVVDAKAKAIETPSDLADLLMSLNPALVAKAQELVITRRREMAAKHAEVLPQRQFSQIGMLESGAMSAEYLSGEERKQHLERDWTGKQAA